MAVRMDKLTYKAQEALSGAQELARQLSHNQMEPAHLLRALLAQEEGLIPSLLKKLEVDPQSVIKGADDLLARLPRVSGEVQVYLAPALNKALDAAFKQAGVMKDDYVSTEHLFWALAADKGSDAGKLLKSLGLTPEAILKALADLRGTQRVTDQAPEEKFQPLEKYGRDLTEMARAGKLDPVIGRDSRDPPASSRCSPGAPRTTRCSSARPGWARPPSWKAWPSASSTATCPRASRTSDW